MNKQATSSAGSAASPGLGQVIPLSVPLSDQALVQALVSGSEEARNHFCDKYATTVLRVLQRILGKDPDVEDLSQEVFVVALSKVHTLRKPESLKSWLIGIAIKKARHRITKRSRWRFTEDLVAWESLSSVPPAVEVSEELRATYHVLESLPADERIAFALRFIDEMELTEVAESCQVSLSTIKRRLGRAQKKFWERAQRIDTLENWVGRGS